MNLIEVGWLLVTGLWCCGMGILAALLLALRINFMTERRYRTRTHWKCALLDVVRMPAVAPWNTGRAYLNALEDNRQHGHDWRILRENPVSRERAAREGVKPSLFCGRHVRCRRCGQERDNTGEAITPLEALALEAEDEG